MVGSRNLALAISCLFASLVVSVVAQENPNLDVGFRPFGAYEGSEFDAVSIGTRDVTILYPIAGWPQRGSQLRVALTLAYNNKSWGVRETCNLQTGTCTFQWVYQYPITFNQRPKGSVQLITSTGALKYGQRTVKTPGGQNLTIYSALTEDGASHDMAANSNSASGMESIDGTGIWFGGGFFNPPYTYNVVDKRGVLNGVQDTNGNFVTVQGGSLPTIDTMGRNLPSSTASSDSTGCPSNATSWGITNYPGYNGGNLIVKGCLATYSLQTNFHAEACDATNGECGIAAEATATATNLVGVVLYNGVSWSTSPAWSFDYVSRSPNDPSNINYGDLSKVTLPTGATITYTWSSDNLCSGGAAVTPASRVLTSRTVDANDGTGPHTTTYRVINPTPPSNYNVLVTDPAGNDTIHGFAYYGSTYEIQTQYYKGSHTTGTLLKTVGTDYQALPNPWAAYSDCPTGPQLPIRITTTWPNGSSNLVSKVETDHDTYSGNPTEKREYDYGNGTTWTLVRKTDYSYKHSTNANYLNANVLNLVTQETVYNTGGTKIEQTNYTYDGPMLQGSSVTMHHNSLANPGYRGNLTLVQKWLNTTGGLVTTKQTSYYDTGAPYQSTDLKGNLTIYTFDPAYYGAYLTQTQFPSTGTGNSITHSISGAYDFNTGKLTSFTDQNSQVSSYLYDSLWRIYSASFPDGGSVGVTYTDSIPVQIAKTVKVTSALNKWSNTIFDGLGRVSQTQMHDPDCTAGSTLVKVDHSYGFDTTQNTTYSTATTPYCDAPGTIYGLSSRTDADALGRPVKVTGTDGSVVSTSYSANCATVTDEAGKARQSCTDGLDRMTGVWEDPNGVAYRTDYTYDVMNNLVSTAQRGGDTNSAHWRPRSFVYDSLSRLTSANNPESGSLSYTYSNSSGGCSGDPGAVCTKTAPAPNAVAPSTATAVTTFYYDNLHRFYKKTYSDTTPAVSFGYDADTSTLTCSNQPGLTDSYPKSARTAMCDSSGATSWAHDNMGRVTTEKRLINGSTAYTKSVGYSYNSNGSIASLTYPSNRTVSYTPNGSGGYTAGRPVSAIDSVNSINYVTNASYAPHGGIASFTNGASVTGIETYNARLQPLELYYTNGSTPASASSLQTTTCPSLQSGQVATIMHRAYDFHLGTDNGNVYTISNCLATDRTQNFDYDNLNRIVDAYTTGTSTAQKNWGATYTIDPWGNMYNVGPYTGRVNYPPPLSSTATTGNQLTGFGYDIAGNLVTNGSVSYVYDAENRITNTSGTSYLYDGNGERVVKCTGAYPSCSSATLYWRGLGGAPLAELNWSGAITNEYTFFNGTRVARRNGTGNTPFYYFADHLGSADVVTDNAGAIQKQSDYQPYGNEVSISGTTFLNNYKFTGKERDSESTLDNFGARYHASNLGRFMTPDWAARAVTVPSADLADPQSLNLYAYVRNQPTKTVDIDGHDIAVIENGPTTSISSFIANFLKTGHAKGNPVGHTAFAVTGRGVFSAGNGTPPGTPLSQYLKDQAKTRDTKITVIKTTPEQDKAAADKFMEMKNTKGERLSYPDNCSSRTNRALDAAGIPGITPPLGNGNSSYTGPTPDPAIPGSAGARAEQYNLQTTGSTGTVDVPRGATTTPSSLDQFDPTQMDEFQDASDFYPGFQILRTKSL